MNHLDRVFVATLVSSGAFAAGHGERAADLARSQVLGTNALAIGVLAFFGLTMLALVGAITAPDKSPVRGRRK